MTQLSPPSPALRACVVVPARDEEALIGRCLDALALQENISPGEYEVLLVLDRCTDRTEDRAREASAKHPALRLLFLDGPGKGAGHARRVGMEAACGRLFAVGRPAGLISSTDADTVVAPDWLAEQLRAAARGARAVGGRIELEDGSGLPDGVARWRREQGRARHRDAMSAPGATVRPEHGRFSGASLALTAEAYAEVGGLEPRAALEDEHLEMVLQRRGIPIERPRSVRVTTSARLVGRARRGLARDLALASWLENNTFDLRDPEAEELLARRRVGISVVAPATGKEEEHALHEELAPLEASGRLDGLVLRVPDADGTPAAGFGPVRGYGDRLWRALSAARGEIVAFLDPEHPADAGRRLTRLVAPLLLREDLELVKGFYSNPDPLSELVARPLLNLHFPELAGFRDPLCRDFAARRSLLESLPFPAGDGARLSPLLDASRLAGVGALAQSDLGFREAPSPALSDLSDSAHAVLVAAAARALGRERLEDLAPGPLFLPTSGGLELRRPPLEERPPLGSISAGQPVSKGANGVAAAQTRPPAAR